MKKMILLVAIAVNYKAIGQNNIAPSDTLQIAGKIANKITLTLAALDTFKQTTIGEVKMLNRNGAIKEQSNLKGILLKDLFAGNVLQASNPKELYRYFLVLSATDNFKLILSWNEVFHTQGCSNFYLITEKDGKKTEQLAYSILIEEVSDTKIGHNRIQSLNKITVEEAE